MTLWPQSPAWFSQQSRLTLATDSFLLFLPFAALIGNSYSDIWLSVTAAALLVYSAIKRDWRWARETWFVLAIVFWAWLMIASIVSQWPQNAMAQAAPWIRFPVFAAAFAVFYSSERMKKAFMTAATAGVMILVVTLLIERLQHPDAVRLYGTWGQHTKAGWYLVGIGLPVILWHMQSLKDKPSSYAWRLPIILATIISTISTGEVFSSIIIVAGTTMFAVILRPSWKVMAGAAGASILLAGLLLGTVDGLHERFVYSFAHRLPWMATSDYYDAWVGGLRVGLLNPIIGVGADNFEAYCNVQKQAGQLADALKVSKCHPHPHHLYIQVFAETGIIGLLLFVALVAAIMKKALACHPFTARKVEQTAPFMVLFLVFWPISTYSQAFGQHKNFFTWFLVGWALALCRSYMTSQSAGGPARTAAPPVSSGTGDEVRELDCRS